jgi:hypothetical protein
LFGEGSFAYPCANTAEAWHRINKTKTGWIVVRTIGVGAPRILLHLVLADI